MTVVQKKQKIENINPNLTNENGMNSLDAMVRNNQQLTAMALKMNQESTDLVKAYFKVMAKK